MAETEREPQHNPLEDVAAAASDSLHGQTVSLTGSATRRVDAGQVKMQASSAGSIKSHAAHLENSAAGLVTAGSIETHDSAIGLAVGREVHLSRSATPLILAAKVESTEVRTVLLAAGKVQGNVQAVFTIWSALAAGFGVGAALIGLGQLFSRRAPATQSATQRRNATAQK
jgi:hypothetical protein